MWVMLLINKYFSKLNQVELGERRAVIFHKDNTKPHDYFSTMHKLLELGTFCSSSICTWYCMFRFQLILVLMKKTFKFFKDFRRCWELYYAKEDKIVMGIWGYEITWKMAKHNGIKKIKMLRNKFNFRNKKMSFYFA